MHCHAELVSKTHSLERERERERGEAERERERERREREREIVREREAEREIEREREERGRENSVQGQNKRLTAILSQVCQRYFRITKHSRDHWIDRSSIETGKGHS